MSVKGSEDSSTKADLDQANARARDLAAANEKLQGEQQRLAEQLRTQTAALEAARATPKAPEGWTQERASLRTQVEDMFNKLSESERRQTQLKTSGDSARAQAQTAQSDLDAARTEAAQLKAKLGDSAKAVDSHNDAVAELTGLNEKLTSEKNTLQAQLTKVQSAAERTRADLAEFKTRLMATNQAMETRNANETELAAANDKLQQQMKDLSAQVATLRTDNARLAQTGNDTAALRNEVSELKAKLADTDKVAEQQGTSVAELTGLNEKLASANKNLETQLDRLNSELASAQADRGRLAQSEQGRQAAEQRVASLNAATTQLSAAQRELTNLRTDNSRLNETVQAIERDRTARIAQLQQENAAISARLRQAQGTLDQIASAARIISGASGSNYTPPATVRTSLPPVETAPVAAAAARSHTVADGDSLTRISLRYYGTPNRWQDIYDANRDILRGENALRPGQRLKIP